MLIAMGLASLTACHKPGSAAAPGPENGRMPPRKAGLWIQSMNHDGKPGRWGDIKMCVDAATDAQISMLGRQFAKGPCERTVTRDAGSVYHFLSTCRLGENGVVTSRGTASGDFVATYRVHTENDIAGAPFPPINGHHVTEVAGRYAGPCPANMAPGDITISSLHMNLNRLPMAQKALGLQ